LIKKLDELKKDAEAIEKKLKEVEESDPA